MGIWTRGKFINEYVPGLFSLSIDTYETKRAESMWQKLVTSKDSGKKSEENSLRSGLGLPVLKPETKGVDFDVQIAGAKQKWVHYVYALAVRISEESVEDNLYELNAGGKNGELPEIFHDLGEAMSENEETLMARFLVNGAATTYHSTRNSKALFATDHPRLDGTTYSNKATSADLTYTSFWAAIVAAENQYNHRRYRIKKRVERLWIPPQLERKGLEITKSTDRPDTADRAINAYASSGRNIELVPWPFLTDTDAYYFQLDGKGIIHFKRRPTRFAKEQDWSTGDMLVKADQRWSAEINDPQSWYGNVPA